MSNTTIADRLDGMINLLTELGSSKDRTSLRNNRSFKDDTIDQHSLSTQYVDNDYAALAVDILPDEATKNGFECKLIDEDGQESKPFDKANKELDSINKLAQADKWARLYGGGAVILGINDGQEFDQPLDFKRIKSLDWLMVVTRHELTRGQLERDPKAWWGYAKPASYTLQQEGMEGLRSPDGATNQIQSGTVIHASRMIRFYGYDIPPEMLGEYDYWGGSVLQRAMPKIINLTMSERAIGNIVQTFTQQIFKKKNLGGIARSKNGKKEMTELFSIMALAQSMLGMMIVDEGEEFIKSSTSVSGLPDLYDRLAQAFAGTIKAPITKVFGQSPGGLSTDDASGRKNWNANVAMHQHKYYVPGLYLICQILAASMPEINESECEIVITPNPLDEPTEQERAETFKALSEAHVTLIDRGVQRAEELRQSIEQNKGKLTDEVVLIQDDDLDFGSFDDPDDPEGPAVNNDPTAPKIDANTDPPEKRRARRRVQTLVENGTLKPVKDCKCADCGKPASEYDHRGYDKRGKLSDKVEPLCASCHHLRTNARKRKTGGPAKVKE